MDLYLCSLSSLNLKILRLVFGLQILWFSSAWAQTYRELNQYSSQIWTTAQGLPNTGILDILQTEDGFIWIATYGGLVRFDGVNFENYADIFPERKLSFSVLCQGQNDRLWLGSANGLFFFQDGQFQKLESGEKFSPYIESLMSDKKGKLWIGTRSDGIYIYDTDKIRKLKGIGILENAFISDITEGKNDEIWVASPRLGVIQIKNGETQRLTTEDGLTSSYVNGLYYESERDRLWICSADGLFILVNGKITKITELIDIECYHINQYGDFFYVSSSFGLYVINMKGDVIDKYASGKSPQLVASRFDYEGNIWLAGYRSGLTKLSPKKFHEYNRFNGLDGNSINTILEIEKDSILLANDLGIVFNITKKGIEQHPISKVTEDQRIRDLYKDQLGNIWVSTYHGIYKFSKGLLTNHQWLSSENQLTNNSIRFTQEDSQGNYWVGSRTGLFKMNSSGQVKKVYTKNDSLSNDFILRVFEDITHDLWIGTAGGGVNLLKTDGTIKRLSKQHGEEYNVVFSFHQSHDSAIWITHNGGLSRYYKGKFQILKDVFELENSSIFELEEDNLGYFWLTTGEGIIRVKKDTLKHYLETGKKFETYDFFNKSDGILISSATPNANILKDSNGNLWFPMVYGTFKVNPNQIPKNTLVPPVYVTSIKLDGKKQYAPFTRLIIPKDVKRLQIDYTALSYQAIERVKFKCKLEGYDDHWVNMENKRFTEYTNLAPGKYTFRVIASNNDGVWNETGNSLEIKIEAAFYETSLFYFLMALVVAGLFYLVFRFRTYQIRLRNQELTKQVALRTEKLEEQNQELEHQNEEVKIANEKINNINNSLEETLTLLKHQKDAITASISYAQRIQHAILPTESKVKKLLPQSFIFFKPRDAVSGDFYFLEEVDGKIILAAVDCTGHGVPGAFMSMVGNNLLHAIVSEKRITEAHQILTQLHLDVRVTLQQKETQNRDGMDMALVVIDKRNKMLEFTGAKNPLVYIQDNEIHQIKGDRISIGGVEREKKRIFTKHLVSFEKPTIVYLFSDGIQDQFGGEKNRKFMIKRLRNLLFEIYQKPMAEQKIQIHQTIENWREEGNEQQIDDMLLIGIHL